MLNVENHLGILSSPYFSVKRACFSSLGNCYKKRAMFLPYFSFSSRFQVSDCHKAGELLLVNLNTCRSNMQHSGQWDQSNEEKRLRERGMQRKRLYARTQLEGRTSDENKYLYSWEGCRKDKPDPEMLCILKLWFSVSLYILDSQ